MRTLLRNKKGVTLDDVRLIVLALLLIGVLAGVGLYILLQMRLQIDTPISTVLTNQTTAQIVNDTGGFAIGTNYTTQRACSFTLDYVTNGTSSVTIDSANYTVTGCKIAYTAPAANAGINNSYWNVSGTVTYDIDSTGAAAVMNTTGAGNDLVGWIPIIVVVLAAAIVIGIVINRFRSFGVS